MNYRFENRLLGRSFVRYIVPATLTMAFGQIAPLVDAACISARLGDAALSVLSVTAPVYYFINIIAVLGGVSAGVGICGKKVSTSVVAGALMRSIACIKDTVSLKSIAIMLPSLI